MDHSKTNKYLVQAEIYRNVSPLEIMEIQVKKAFTKTVKFFVILSGPVIETVV